MIYTLHQGDCLDFLRTLDAESVDAVITDPPYGTMVEGDGYGRRQIWNGEQQIVGDADTEVMRLGMTEAFRVLKADSWAVMFCSPKRHGESLAASASAGFRHVGEFVWDKAMPGLGGGIRYQHENILLLAKGEPSGRSSISSVIRHPSRSAGESPVHPHRKPLKVVAQLILYASDPRDTVLDPFMGSGTTGEAALRLGRVFIGCEISPDYFATAEKRIAEAADSTPLFDRKAERVAAPSLFDASPTP